jgi:hypothetical protein
MRPINLLLRGNNIDYVSPLECYYDSKGFQDGYKAGFKEGHSQGYRDGYVEGLQEGAKELLIFQLTDRFQHLPDNHLKQIQEASFDTLYLWAIRGSYVATLEEVFN